MTDHSRRRAALTEPMTVLVDDPETLQATVASSSGSTYQVDLGMEVCTCPDMQYNLPDGERCKHVWRALWATGVKPIPQDVIDAHGEDADPYLGRWSPGEVREVVRDELAAGDGPSRETFHETDKGGRRRRATSTTGTP